MGAKHHPKIKMLCPECKNMITYIVNTQSVLVRFHVSANTKSNQYRYGKPQDMEFLENPGINTWSCPKCDSIICKNSTEVVALFEKWLKNRGNLR